MYRVVFFVFATLPYLASATITLGISLKVRETFLIYHSFYVSACFSIPFTTLPSITLNGLNPILNTSAVSFPIRVSDWSMEDLDTSDWLKFLFFLKLFFPKTPGKIGLKVI